MKTFQQFKKENPVTWKYAIKKIEDDPTVYALVEEYKGGEIGGAYVIVLDGGEKRSDIVATIQMMVVDSLTDKEIAQLEKMIVIRKERKKK